MTNPIQTQRDDGQWVPAIPLAYRNIKYQCGGSTTRLPPWTHTTGDLAPLAGLGIDVDAIVVRHHCPASFWTKDGYRAHFALVHILGER